MQTHQPRHPIRVVAQRTGLTTATLRAWERRYRAVEPARTESGQRVYSDADVERLSRLKTLADAGRPISMLAALSDDDVHTLLEEDRAAAAARAAPAHSNGGAEGRWVEDALECVHDLDGEGLEAELRRAAMTMGAIPFLEDVVAPLLRGVGDGWAEGRLTPAHEHLCTAVLERVLRWLTEPISAGAEGGVVIVATLPGERHGLGARLAAVAASLAGCRVTDLGVDLPVEDIARAAEAVHASTVLLSIVHVEGRRDARDDLERLRALLPAGVGLVVGGRSADRLAAEGLPPGTNAVASLGELRELLA